jgi:hypothetical protein
MTTLDTISPTSLETVSGGTVDVTIIPFTATRKPNFDENGAINGGYEFLRVGNYKCLGAGGAICGGQEL